MGSLLVCLCGYIPIDTDATHPNQSPPQLHPNHSGRETNRGVRPSENTINTYLCGIRRFLDRPGVVPLPSPKLASKCVFGVVVSRAYVFMCVCVYGRSPHHTMPHQQTNHHRKELKKYLIMHGSGFFGQWAKRGFKVNNAHDTRP